MAKKVVKKSQSKTRQKNPAVKQQAQKNVKSSNSKKLQAKKSVKRVVKATSPKAQKQSSRGKSEPRRKANKASLEKRGKVEARIAKPKKHRLGFEIPATSEVQQTVQKEAEIRETDETFPSRPPKRIIVGADNTVVETISIHPRPEDAEVDAPESEPEAPAPRERVQEPEVKYPWKDLPQSVPHHFRFFISSAADTCSEAETWPFAFAKLVASLPGAVCGVGFLLNVLSPHFGDEALADMLGFDIEVVRSKTESAKEALDEKFSAICGDMYRKWTAQLAGGEKSVDALLEQFMVPKLDQGFQLMIGEVLLRVLGAENPLKDGRPQRDQWTFQRNVLH